MEKRKLLDVFTDIESLGDKVSSSLEILSLSFIHDDFIPNAKDVCFSIELIKVAAKEIIRLASDAQRGRFPEVESCKE